jgi:Leucine-rich repeat (LRR) protein
MSTNQGNSVSHPWRRYLRFSVRGLIVLVLLIGAGLAWLVRSARIQRDAVAVIERAGGNVAYAMPLGPRRFTHGFEPRWTKWIANRLGVDTFCRVRSVRFSGRPSNAKMDYVGRLSSLEELLLTNANVTDAGMVHLEGLTKLDSVYLEQTQISDAGLAHLKDSTGLRLLSISDTRITDAGMVHLEGLTNLDSLYLNRTQVTDAGLLHLKGLTKLKFLDLQGTQVTDAGVKELQQALPNLKIAR